ncbi:MAG: 16S rRNA (uracil(1498)-N(3))-methyltransferase [Natronospirillum sp.]
MAVSPNSMRIPRIYEPIPLAVGSEIALSANAVQHLIKALRLSTGDPVVVFNGEGSDFSGELVVVSKSKVKVRLQSSWVITNESPVAVDIGLGMSLGDRMEYAIQKATETGVHSVTPLETVRSELRLKGERAKKKQQRWQQVAISAAEQCGRATVPVIQPVLTLPNWCAQQPETALRLVLHHEHATRLGDLPTPDSVSALIGPEGGLDVRDLDAALETGFTAVVLGPRVLRTETAPVALLAAVQTLWGDY